jgi:hypothetical protein
MKEISRKSKKMQHQLEKVCFFFFIFIFFLKDEIFAAKSLLPHSLSLSPCVVCVLLVSNPQKRRKITKQLPRKSFLIITFIYVYNNGIISPKLAHYVQHASSTFNKSHKTFGIVEQQQHDTEKKTV